MARVFSGQRTFLDPVLAPVERGFNALAGVDPKKGQDWKAYTIAMLTFSVVGFITLYALQRFQASLPLNPSGFGAVSADSFVQHRGKLRHQYKLAGL